MRRSNSTGCLPFRRREASRPRPGQRGTERGEVQRDVPAATARRPFRPPLRCRRGRAPAALQAPCRTPSCPFRRDRIRERSPLSHRVQPPPGEAAPRRPCSVRGDRSPTTRVRLLGSSQAIGTGHRCHLDQANPIGADDRSLRYPGPRRLTRVRPGPAVRLPPIGCRRHWSTCQERMPARHFGRSSVQVTRECTERRRRSRTR